MAFLDRADGSEPPRPDPVGHVGGTHEERRTARTGLLAMGTLACSDCDVPVAPGPVPRSPADPIRCPYCGCSARVRDFLSLRTPGRPAQVEVRVVVPAGILVDRPAPAADRRRGSGRTARRSG